MSAVIWTDFVQTILMIIGAVWLMITSFNAVGGYEQLIDKYRYKLKERYFICLVGDNSINLLLALISINVFQDIRAACRVCEIL